VVDHRIVTEAMPDDGDDMCGGHIPGDHARQVGSKSMQVTTGIDVKRS
jgi:hypothetical protein